MQQYSIDANELPHNARIINKPETFIEAHFEVVIASLTVFVVLLTLIIVLLLNIKKRKASELQLRKKNREVNELNKDLEESKKSVSEERNKFKALFHNHNAVKMLLNPEDGSIFDANRAAADFYGYSIATLKSMHIYDINALPNEIIKEKMESVDSAKQTRFEFKHKKENGTVVDVEVLSSLVPIMGKNYIYSLIHDISEKKKLEQKSKILSRAVEQSPISIIVTNVDGRIEYVNPALQQTRVIVLLRH